MKELTQLLVASCLMLSSPLARAETKRPPETRNAALRYWLAFAEIRDQTTDKNTADLLEKTAAGEAAWDEAALGPILDRNQDAILALQRASKLPECDWGLEYEQGPNASIAYVPRARVLGRLNTLYGMRMAAKGNTEEAINAWLAGIRFSQHVARGGSLIFALIGKTVLLANLQALAPAAESGKFSVQQKQQIAKIVEALPEAGFDWSAALWYEQEPLDVAVKQMAQSPNPRKYYEELTGRPITGISPVPNKADLDSFHGLMADAQAALRVSPGLAQNRLRALQESVKTLHPFYQATIPSFSHINEARTELQLARERLLRAVSTR